MTKGGDSSRGRPVTREGRTQDRCSPGRVKGARPGNSRPLFKTCSDKNIPSSVMVADSEVCSKTRTPGRRSSSILEMCGIDKLYILALADIAPVRRCDWTTTALLLERTAEIEISSRRFEGRCILYYSFFANTQPRN